MIRCTLLAGEVRTASFKVETRYEANDCDSDGTGMKWIGGEGVIDSLFVKSNEWQNCLDGAVRWVSSDDDSDD